MDNHRTVPTRAFTGTLLQTADSMPHSSLVRRMAQTIDFTASLPDDRNRAFETHLRNRLFEIPQSADRV